MTRELAVCALLFASTIAQAQQHAPSKARCDADLNLWRSGLITGAQGEWALRDDAKISFMDILNEAREMGVCEGAYMPGERLGSGPYADLGKVLDSLIETRLIAFMKRHPEALKQFLQEDAAGMR